MRVKNVLFQSVNVLVMLAMILVTVPAGSGIAQDRQELTVTIDQAVSQEDPTNASPINYTVIFSAEVTDFQTGDVTLAGTAGATTATVTGSGTTYNIAVSGMTTSGTVIASIPAGVAQDAALNLNQVSTSSDNEVTFVMRYTLTVEKTGAGAGTVISNPAGIECGDACSADFDDGTSVTLTANASTGSTFAGWSGSDCTGTSTCTLTMDQARSVTADFTLNQYQLTVSKVGQGTVMSSPAGIACGDTCSAMFDYGTTVILTPVAENGYSFSAWTGTNAGELTNNGDGTWSILITGPKSLTANFSSEIVITAVDDDYEMPKGEILDKPAAEGVFKNDIRPVSVTLRAEKLSDPAVGTVTLGTDGSIFYRDLPSAFVGEVNFDYKACDTATNICSEPATVTIAVKTVPTAEADSYKMGFSTVLNVAVPGVLSNDSGDVGAVLEAEKTSEPTSGTLNFNSDGSFQYTPPSASWTGTASFSYQACDGTVCSNPVTVTIEVAPSCLVVDPTSLEQTLFPDTTGTLDLTLINTCHVLVNYNLVESGGVTGTPILEEGFENESNPTFPPDFPPDVWDMEVQRANRTWRLAEGSLFVDEGRFASWVEFSEPGITSNEWLISPVLNTRDKSNLVLSFRAKSETLHKGGTLKIWVTDVNGDPITTFSEEPLWDLLRDVNWPVAAFRTVQVDLGQFNNYGNIRIAWQYVSVDPYVRGPSFGLDEISMGGRSDISWTTSLSPATGPISGNSKQEIIVTFDSTGLSFGSNYATLFVRNAPYPVINVPVTLKVSSEEDFLYFLPLITK